MREARMERAAGLLALSDPAPEIDTLRLKRSTARQHPPHLPGRAAAAPRCRDATLVQPRRTQAAQSVKRISLSLQTSNASASLLPPPSKLAATETVQPFIFGSLTAVRALGASGFESEAVLSPAVMATSVTAFVLALTTVIVPGGPFCFGLGFGAAASGAAAASAGADPGTSGMLIVVCATAGVRPRTRAAQANPVRRE